MNENKWHPGAVLCELCVLEDGTLSHHYHKHNEQHLGYNERNDHQVGGGVTLHFVRIVKNDAKTFSKEFESIHPDAGSPYIVPGISPLVSSGMRFFLL